MEQINLTIKDKALSILKKTFIIMTIATVIAITCFVITNAARNAARGSVKYPNLELNECILNIE